MQIYTELVKASNVLPPWPSTASSGTGLDAAAAPWDDRTQAKAAILRRLALGTAVEHAIPVIHLLRNKQTKL